MLCDDDNVVKKQILCRCGNCCLRDPDTKPWLTFPPSLMMADPHKDKSAEDPAGISRRNSSRTIQSMESVYTISESHPGESYQTRNYDDTDAHAFDAQRSVSPGELLGADHVSTAPSAAPGAQPPQAPTQPTILLIVVNKPEPPYPGRGYPGPGGYRGYPGQDGYPNSYYQPPPRNGVRRCPPGPAYPQNPVRYNDRVPNQNRKKIRSDGYRNGGNGNVSSNRRRVCRCDKGNQNPVDKDGTEGQGETCNCVSDEDYSMQSNEPHPRVCECTDSEDGHHGGHGEFGGTPPNTMNDGMSNNEGDEDGVRWNPNIQRYQDQRNVVVADKNKTAYRCITVPICITTGKQGCCQCCKCAVARNPNEDDVYEEKECTCNPQGKCNCVKDDGLGEEFGCECDLTNLERLLRELLPDSYCKCFLRKRRRRRRKKWAPKKFYDRFASPPFVINPIPKCNPCCYPSCSPGNCFPCFNNCGW
nr:uncharacterized protein CG42266 [Drosophila bipectinata]